MPGNLQVADESRPEDAVKSADNKGPTSRGRKRYCKKCKFTCNDAREFTSHQTSHTASDERKITEVVSLSPVLSTGQSSFQSVRILRRKGNSKEDILEQDNYRATMEVGQDSWVESISEQTVDSIDKVSQNTNVSLFIINGQEAENKQLKSVGKFDFQSVISSQENVEMFEGEGQDEPDAMTTTEQNNLKESDKKLSSDGSENFSAEEDVEEDRLVIDDENAAKQTQARTYSCQHCQLTTTGPKAYLRHIKDKHNTQVNIYDCPVCDYATEYKHKLTKHMKTHYPNNDSDEHLQPTFHPTYKNNDKDNNNLMKYSFTNSPSMNAFFTIDKTGEDEEGDDNDDISSVDHKPMSITPENIDQVLDEDKKKKKKTRQEVDPGKYFEAVDNSGTKYACSQCGNIYKWRKSLNKHWKEKHSMDALIEVASPPGMLELLKSGKYTQLGARRIYDKSFLATIKTNKSDDPSLVKPSTHSLANASGSPNFLNSPSILPNSVAKTATSLLPKIIGPFVAGNTQPVFPGMPMTLQQIPIHTNGYESLEESALDLTRDNRPKSENFLFVERGEQKSHIQFDQEQPLDFSKNKTPNKSVKIEKNWSDTSMKPANNINQLISKIHHCSKCDFSSSSEVEFANHTSSHLNKRIVRCYECKLQINSMDELNNHFIKHHFRKLTDYKEAIKKIPHGLQQTYHLLNMEIHDIGELGNQDLGASEGKSLKCKKCDFEAKWPAELQKHAVSHSEERPYICMVCGSTYKWKWDLVKHFQKSHPNLPNPYRRNDKKDTPDGSSDEEDEPVIKRSKFEMNASFMNGNVFNRDDNITVEGIIAATQAGQRLVSSQPNILDDEPAMEHSLTFLKDFTFSGSAEMNQVAQIVQASQAAQEIDRRNKAQKAIQEAVRNRQNADGSGDSGSQKKTVIKETASSSSSPGGTKSEDLPYKCTMCNYHARWPSEVTQHMKNHSDSKPYLCPRCEYRSKWKWDVVKHLKRCGGGGINDVIDTTKSKRKDFTVSNGPPNAIVSHQGKIKKMTPQPPLTYIMPSAIDNEQQNALLARSGFNQSSDTSSSDDVSRPDSGTSNQEISQLNNDTPTTENHLNNNYTSYTNGLPFENLSQFFQTKPSVLSSVGNMNCSSSQDNSPIATPSPMTITSSRHNAEVWNCPHCPFSTQSQAELKRHSGLHSDDKPFKCDVCQYSTRWACDLKKHRKSYNHFPRTNTPKENKEKTPTSLGRFKCTQCTIYFQTLENLLEHRLSEHVGQDSSQSSPGPETEIDVARIKHPRKQVKKIECPKCPFVCKGRQTMDKHMEEHELLELSGIHCFYCSLLFKDKESLLDHITTHSAFNPKEWETFFMISEEDQHVVKDEQQMLIKTNSKPQIITTADNKTQIAKQNIDSDKNSPDSTEARIQQILNEIPKQLPVSQSSMNKFKCEWCSAEFANLTAVYKHATHSHPIQLKEQAVSMTGQSKQSSVPKLPNKKLCSADTIDILKQQIAEKRNHEIKKNIDGMGSSKTTETPASKVDGDKNLKCYTCEKCKFSSSNLATFQHHLEMHDNKQTSQCWFCDYSVDRMNLLYQHMKISHTRKWKALSQDPKYAAHIHKMNLTFANSSNYTGHNDMTDLNAMDLSFKSPEKSHDIIYITKQQYTWSGIPVNIVPVGNGFNFVCPHCTFHDASIAETCCHVMQSHRAMSKFTCKTCHFSDDNIHVMSDHCKTEHLIQDRIVEVLDFKQINFSELQIVQLNALKEQMAHDLSRKSLDQGETKMIGKVMLCPFCPFKTLIPEHMKKHVSDHSKNALYHCQICDFSSDAPADMHDHAKVHEPNYMLDARSASENQLPLFVKKEFVEKKTTEDNSKIVERVTRLCDSAELSLSDHEDSPRSKSGKRIRYRCSTCPYHTTCKNNMMKHVRQHNNNKKYQCSKCSYGAARAVLLKNHLDSHTAPVEDDGQFYDIFCDPNNVKDTFKEDQTDDFDSEETEMEVDDFDEENVDDEDDDDDDDDDIDSDESNDIDVKAIVDLETKDILKAEAAHPLLTEAEEADNTDRHNRKQKCQLCPYICHSYYELCKHLNLHSTQEKYKCDYCSYSLDKLNLLIQHRRLHAHEPDFNPNPPTANLLNTDFIYQQSSGKTNNQENTENIDSEEEEKCENRGSQFLCSYCPYKTSKKKLFDTHCNGHDIRNPYICDFCDWSADILTYLYQHRRVHKNEPNFNPNPEDSIFLNQEFDNGTMGEEFEAKFMEIKQSDKSQKTPETDTPLSPPFKLTVVKKSYPCKSCPYKTNSKSNYFCHKNMHDSGADFACTQCSYATVNNGLLQQHLRLHNTGCTNASTSSVTSNLDIQQSVDKEMANTQKDSVDPLQSKIISTQSQIRVDNTIGPELKCQHCPFTATSKNILEAHVQCHTAQKNLVCPFCDFSVKSKQFMFSHIQIHFPGTKLEPEAVEHILEQHTKVTNNNSLNIEEDIIKPSLPKQKTGIDPSEIESSSMRRVYVCHFCEKEFESKHLILQHEKQHMLGNFSDNN